MSEVPVHNLALRFGGRLREARKLRGLTQEQAASAVGVARRSWIYWESGEQSPEFERLEPIANVLGVPLSWFFAEGAPEDPATVSEALAAVRTAREALQAAEARLEALLAAHKPTA